MAKTADAHLSRLAEAAAAELLAEMGFEWGRVDGQVCAALRFRREQAEAPAIVGLVGGASSGKSTLFNSLLGREVSRISAHAHETLGPVAAVHSERVPGFISWSGAGLIFPGLECDSRGGGRAPGSHRAPGDDQAQAGRVGAVCVCAHQVADLADVILTDLPDVTSKMSADEGSTTRTLLPWFDGLLIVVDEERWFDATVFDETAEFARNFGPRLWVVFNRTEAGEPLTPEEWRKLADHARQRRTTDSFLSPFQPGSGYRPMSSQTQQQVVAWLGDLHPGRQRAPGRREAELAGYLQGRCAEVVRANAARAEQLGELCHAVDQELAALKTETSLSADLLTDEERALLGLGRRILPLYDLFQSAWRRAAGHEPRTSVRAARAWRRQRQRGLKPAAQKARDQEIDFEKRTEALAELLRRNLEHRFSHATDRIDRLVSDSPYLLGAEHNWSPAWTLPQLDEREWATRIRAHIDAWKEETTQQSRRGDIVGLSLGMPLLLADLLFLGGAGLTLTWATAWMAGLVGGKSLTSLRQRSPAFKAYQTTVRAYQTFIREAVAEQWEANLATMPRRHLPMTDPLLEAAMYWATPGKR